MIEILFLLFAFQSAQDETIPANHSARKIDSIAAIVNNEVITQSELAQRLEPARKSFGFQDPAEWERFSKEQLRALVRDKLYAQAARRSALDQDLIEAQLKRILQDAEKNAGGKANLIEKLQQLGRSYDEFVAERRNEILSYYLIRYELGYAPGASGRYSTEIYVSPGEMRQYYRNHEKEFLQSEAVRGRQIFLSTEASIDPESVQQRATELREQIQAGGDFQSLAKEHSQWRANEGGDLGWVEKGNASFAPGIVSFLFSNSAGSVSEPLRIQGGYALVKVEERREGRMKSFEEVQLSLFTKLSKEREESRWQSLQERLLRDSYVWPADLFLR